MNSIFRRCFGNNQVKGDKKNSTPRFCEVLINMIFINYSNIAVTTAAISNKLHDSPSTSMYLISNSSSSTSN